MAITARRDAWVYAPDGWRGQAPTMPPNHANAQSQGNTPSAQEGLSSSGNGVYSTDVNGNQIVSAGHTGRWRYVAKSKGQWTTDVNNPTVLLEGASKALTVLKFVGDLNLAIQQRAWEMQQQVEEARVIEAQHIIVVNGYVIGRRQTGPASRYPSLWHNVGLPFRHFEYRATLWGKVLDQWSPPDLSIHK